MSNTNQTADAILEYEADDYKHFGRDARDGDLSLPALQQMAKFWLMRDDILEHLEGSAWEGSTELYTNIVNVK